jgi:Regulator of chromosome condensation (RCC1) repeat/PASTA domain
VLDPVSGEQDRTEPSLSCMAERRNIRGDREDELSARSRLLLQFCALAVVSVGILVAPGAAQAAPARPLAWGCASFNFGQCDVPSGLSGTTAISAGRWHSLALKGDGTVVAWGCSSGNLGQCSVPGGLAGVTAVAAGDFHSLALKGDGTVVSWGCGGADFGQCSVPMGLSGVTAIAAGLAHSLALKSDGTVLPWGCGGGADYGQCSVPVGLADVTAIAAGETQSLALKSDGTVVAWGCGSGNAGQCSVPVGLAGVTAIAAGDFHSLALKGDGTVVPWGCGGAVNFGQCGVPAGLSGAIAITAGYGHSLAVKGDGTVVAWGCGSGANYGQCSVPVELAGVTAVAAGQGHSLALAALLDQTITFDPIADRTYGDPGFAPTATASSGLPVSFSATGACFFFGGVVYITSGGFCTVTASQPGGLNFNPAPDVSRTFAIARVRQSITFFPALETKTFGDPDFVVSAFSSSGLPVSFAANGNCVVSGATVHLTGAGFCTMTASQAGDMTYEPAAVSQTFEIDRAVQTTVPPAPAARCRVPKVVGKRLVSAKRIITLRHCRTGKVGYAYSRKRAKGVVISQSRRPGRVLPARSKIALIVSRGRKR